MEMEVVTPDATDALSEVLERLCVPHWLTGLTLIAPGHVIEVPDGYTSFYVVASGTLQLRTSLHAHALLLLDEGDFLLLSHGTSHRLGEGIDTKPVSLAEFLAPRFRTQTPPTEGTTVIHGFLRLASMGRNPFAGVLPEFIRISANSTPMLESSRHLMDMIVEEQRVASAGWRAVVNRIVQVLFMQTLRAHLASQPQVSQQANWLRAATDPTIGPVLARIHAEPEKPWTVNSLAKQINLAKSAFTERFRQVVGEPPLQYLTGYRMQKACELLWQSNIGVKDVATLVGYESASSFSNAFKRLNGKSPEEFRTNGC